MGAGIGNISRFLLKDHPDLCISEFEEAYIGFLKRRFPDQTIQVLNLADPDFQKREEALGGSFDTLIAVNVLEHIQHDQLAIQNALSLLKSGGNLILLVPAHHWLQNPLDHHLHHYRRYTRKTIVSLCKSTGGNMISCRYFNFLGAIGWFLFGNMLRYTSLKSWQVRGFDVLTPFAKWLDSIISNAFGLSLIAVIRKSE